MDIYIWIYIYIYGTISVLLQQPRKSNMQIFFAFASSTALFRVIFELTVECSIHVGRTINTLLNLDH